MSDNTKVMVALLAGLAAGAALGILFAPEAGAETRDKLSWAILSKKQQQPKLTS
jgi:gas vesicle protein